jgi:hypothetical protein
VDNQTWITNGMAALYIQARFPHLNGASILGDLRRGDRKKRLGRIPFARREGRIYYRIADLDILVERLQARQLAEEGRKPLDVPKKNAPTSAMTMAVTCVGPNAVVIKLGTSHAKLTYKDARALAKRLLSAASDAQEKGDAA